MQMSKARGIALMGGSISAAAKNLGVVYQSVYKWSDPLPNWLRWQIKGYLLEKKQSRKLKACEQKTCIAASAIENKT